MAVAALLAQNKEISGFETFYRETGYYLARLEKYEKALKYFDNAIEKTPKNLRALLGRAKTLSQIGVYKSAIQDIANALEIDPVQLTVLAHKARLTYLNCEFEEGLVQNVRLMLKRKKPDYFTMGVMDCTNAIENCIGERVGRPLRDHFLIIRRLAWIRNYEAQKPFHPKSKLRTKKIITKDSKDVVLEGKPKKKIISTVTEEILDSLSNHELKKNYISPYGTPFPYKPLQNYTSNLQNYMAEKYLDRMYLDKLFLKQVISEKGIRSPNKEGTANLIELARDGYKKVANKQELLRTRKPFYFIKYQEAISAGGLKQRQDAELKRQQENNKTTADELLKQIECALEKKQLRILLDCTEKLREFCITTHIKLLPDRYIYLENVYKCIRNAFYDLCRINRNQKPLDQDKRIYTVFGLPVLAEPSKDSIIEQFKEVYADYRKKIQICENRLKCVRTQTELVLLYYELAIYYFELKRYEFARVYAKKCMREGRHLNDYKWVVNAYMALAKISIGQHNKNDTKNHLQAVLQISKEKMDKTLQEFTERCLLVLEKLEFDDVVGFKVLEKREQQIIKLMANSKMKDEVSHLFRTMSGMPASRRMAILPGIRIEDLENLEKKRTPQIDDNQNEMVDIVKKSPKKKRILKQHSPAGAKFMELIQYHLD